MSESRLWTLFVGRPPIVMCIRMRESNVICANAAGRGMHKRDMNIEL